MEPELLTIEAAAQLLMVGRATAYSWARNGLIPIVRVNGLIRVPRAALLRWIEAQADGSHVVRAASVVPTTDHNP